MRKVKKQDDVINIDEARENRRQKREEELNKKNRRAPKASVVKEKLSKGEINRNNKIRYLVFFASLIILFYFGVSMFNIVNLKIEENKAFALQEKLKNEKISLQNVITNINSPEYIEQQARIQLKMIKPGEILYVFPVINEENKQTEAQ